MEFLQQAQNAFIRRIPFCCFLGLFFFFNPAFAYQLQKNSKSSMAEKNSWQSRGDLTQKSSSLSFTNRIDWDADIVENKARLVNLRYDKTSRSIRLDDTKLIEDDAPATGLPEGYVSYTTTSGPVAWVEDLKEGIVIKKILNIDNPSAVSGRVVFKGIEVQDNLDTLYLSLNGKEFLRAPSQLAFPKARQYIDLEWDRWFYVDLPVESLRKGKNELLMWTESDSTSWRILVAHAKEFKRGSLTRREHPNRSMKSSDGGISWSDSKLGALDSIDGEYSVRLSLDQYRSSGGYVSPLIDPIDGDNVIKKLIDDVKVSIWPELEKPEHTDIHTFVRFGRAPDLGETWSAWMPLEVGKEYSLGDKRYMQWKAQLITSDPLSTPRISGIRIVATGKDISPNKKKGLAVKVVNNGEILRISYPFSYENLNHPGLKKYRERHRLDDVVAGAESEFEVMMRLLNWAYRVPLTHEAYSWNWNDVTVQTASEPEKPTPTTMEPGDKSIYMPRMNGPFFKGRRMVGMCLYPNQALIGALLSMGYQARHININSEAMSGHEVAEVWSNEFNKWIYLDATRDYYYFDVETGTPLNLLEIHNLLVEQMPRVENWKHPFVPDIGKEVVSHIDVGMRQGNNPFSIEEGGGRYLLETMGHFRIIPRNDFLSNPLPVPVHTGNTSWGWDGFLNWYDDTFPKRDEYQRYTNRAMDFYQPLNQAEVFLMETEESGVLQVNVKNFTPGGFKTYLVRTDGDKWISKKKSIWNWELHSGKNELAIRVENVKGVLGPISYFLVNFNP